MTKFSAAMTVAAFSAALVLAGCSTPKPVEAPPSAPSAPPAATSSIVPGSAEDLRVNVGDTVHFAYNQYNIEDNDKATLQRQATWLQKYPSVRVTVEGDCDERGTREYNLALGERRANAAKDYLVAKGISAARLKLVSYGKERPAVLGSNEAAWAQNRRAVGVVN
jgi:peptidoglycan-associated lipoprotein